MSDIIRLKWQVNLTGLVSKDAVFSKVFTFIIMQYLIHTKKLHMNSKHTT